MKETAREAAVRVLVKAWNYEILAEDFKGFIVFKDRKKDELVFCSLSLEFGEQIDIPVARSEYERAIVRFLEEHDEVSECRIRYDIMNIHAFSSGRAIARHVVDVVFTDEM